MNLLPRGYATNVLTKKQNQEQTDPVYALCAVGGPCLVVPAGYTGSVWSSGLNHTLGFEWQGSGQCPLWSCPLPLPCHLRLSIVGIEVVHQLNDASGDIIEV